MTYDNSVVIGGWLVVAAIVLYVFCLSCGFWLDLRNREVEIQQLKREVERLRFSADSPPRNSRF
jgi:hypothetical protein